jgi:hypothetical protein
MMWEEIMWPTIKYYFGIYMGNWKETIDFLIQYNIVWLGLDCSTYRIDVIFYNTKLLLNKHNISVNWQKSCVGQTEVSEDHITCPFTPHHPPLKIVLKWWLLHTCVYNCFDCIIPIYSTQLCAK